MLHSFVSVSSVFAAFYSLIHCWLNLRLIVCVENISMRFDWNRLFSTLPFVQRFSRNFHFSKQFSDDIFIEISSVIKTIWIQRICCGTLHVFCFVYMYRFHWMFKWRHNLFIYWNQLQLLSGKIYPFRLNLGIFFYFFIALCFLLLILSRLFTLFSLFLALSCSFSLFLTLSYFFLLCLALSCSFLLFLTLFLTLTCSSSHSFSLCFSLFSLPFFLKLFLFHLLKYSR